uniref:Hexosyltransferase n=2 Tax=Esox lucius TaxID=8010 RepID=A0AAY5JYX0_ESOLU
MVQLQVLQLLVEIMRILLKHQSCCKWSIVFGTAMLISVIFIMMDHKFPPTDRKVYKLLPVNQSEWYWKATAHITPPQPTKHVVECSVDNGMQNIPSHLPAPHRNFLMYKHCRKFPRLLSPTPCENDLFLLLAIKSTAIQVDRRIALRSTWGKRGYIEGKRVKLLFLVGKSSDRIQEYSLQQLLEWESRQFGDILQWNFKDTFFNLTLKEVHFLDWFSLECKWAQYVFKGDDDVFVHTSNLLEYVKDHNPSEHLFAGDIIPKAYPIRQKHLKYFIPKEMYPDKEYPPYAGGGGYLMSRKTVLSLGVAASSMDLFPIDDVYVGMCLLNINITLTHHPGFKTFGFKQVVSHFNPCIYREMMLVHKLNPTEMWTMWSLLQDPKLQCFIKT